MRQHVCVCAVCDAVCILLQLVWTFAVRSEAWQPVLPQKLWFTDPSSLSFLLWCTLIHSWQVCACSVCACELYKRLSVDIFPWLPELWEWKSLKIAAASRCLRLPSHLSNSACNPIAGSWLHIIYLWYIYNYPAEFKKKEWNCNRITPHSPTYFFYPLCTYTVCTVHSHIRLAPLTSDLFILSLSFTPQSNASADSRQVNLCWVFHNRVSFHIIARRRAACHQLTGGSAKCVPNGKKSTCGFVSFKHTCLPV